MKLIVKQHIIAQQRTVLGHYSGGEVEMDAKDDMVAVASKVDMTRRSKNVDAHLHVFGRLYHLSLLGCPVHGSHGPTLWGGERSIMDLSGPRPLDEVAPSGPLWHW